jgi:hypothetical protein
MRLLFAFLKGAAVGIALITLFLLIARWFLSGR